MKTPEPPTKAWGIEALRLSREARRKQLEENAQQRERSIQRNRYYYDAVKRLLRYIIEPGKRVLEVRCATGHLLDAVKPSYGVGVEISEKMIAIASSKYPHLHYVRSDPETLEIDEKFDYVIFSHIFDTVDLLGALRRIHKCCHPDTRLVIYSYNYLWQPMLELASRWGLRATSFEPNWVSEYDVKGFLELAGFEAVRTHRRLLFPKWIPLVSYLLNGLLASLPGFRRLCLVQITVARPKAAPKKTDEISVSVIIPCRNERDNVLPAVERMPEMGKHTEIIFCDDKSTDGTGAEVERLIKKYPERDIRLVEGPAICKAENVWTGFRAARGDVLMILDGDLAVMPEELPYFLTALASGTGEFINGSRLVYPIPEHAMKFSNMVGNKLFGALFSYLLDQRIKDTLCGTKVLWRKDWQRIEPDIGNWGIQDRWGDYELLFGASKLHLPIRDLPVHYQERIYGVTKMTRVFSNGMRMLGICWGAWRRLKA
jgi:SAM-dependent methyltransferase